MKTKFCPLILLSFLFIQSGYLIAQNKTDFNNLIPGKTYKIVLFDDTEIFGKVISADSVNISVVTEDKANIIIPKNNILYYSTDLTPSKYKYSVSLLGGVSLFASNNGYGYNYSSASAGPNINASGILFLSDTKAIKIDAGYTFVKAKYDDIYYEGNPMYQTTFEGGNTSLYSLKGNIMFGSFNPEEKILLYVSLGLGIHYSNQQEVKEKHWQQNFQDTTWTQYTYTTPARSEINALLSIGGSVGYRINTHFGIKAELEFNMVTNSYAFVFFGGRNYFPMRAGIFYIL